MWIGTGKAWTTRLITALDSDEGCGFMIVKCSQMAYNRIRLKRRCTTTDESNHFIEDATALIN